MTTIREIPATDLELGMFVEVLNYDRSKTAMQVTQLNHRTLNDGTRVIDVALEGGRGMSLSDTGTVKVVVAQAEAPKATHPARFHLVLDLDVDVADVAADYGITMAEAIEQVKADLVAYASESLTAGPKWQGVSTVAASRVTVG